ncbi:MAG: hypothetical protein UD936_09560, partial [Acutalibacteraceae bacterium]|nr:hypothetical protein [Acutalibacteraceae bacterium]
MKQESDNNFNNDVLSDWGNPYNDSTANGQSTGDTTQNQYGNAYGNNPTPNQYGNAYSNNTMPNQYGNAYGNNTMPNQYGNAYGNNAMPNQYGNAYGNNPMPNQYGNAYGNNAMPNQYGNAYGNNPMPNQYYNGMPPYNAGQYQQPKKKKKIWLIILLAVVLPIVLISGCTVAIFGIVFTALDEVKDSEEYKLAYSYVVESDLFDRLDVDESEIRLNGFSTTVSGTSHGDRSEFTFIVDG